MSEIDYDYEHKHRQENNLAIVDELKRFFEDYPQIRFIQGLWSLGIITRDEHFNIEDRFYEEPGETLKKVKENVNSRC